MAKTYRDHKGTKTPRYTKKTTRLVFFVCSFLISLALSFYYQKGNPLLDFMDVPHRTAVQAFGQVSEIFFMLLIPIGLARLGTKNMLAIGYLAWVLRYLTFATVNMVLVLGIVGGSVVALAAVVALVISLVTQSHGATNTAASSTPTRARVPTRPGDRSLGGSLR